MGTIAGYRALTEEEVDLINRIKAHERDTAHLWACVADRISTSEPGRQVSIARTEFEHAFMRLVRSIAQPATPWNDTAKDS